MQLTIEVNITDSDTGFTRSQKFATFPAKCITMRRLHLGQRRRYRKKKPTKNNNKQKPTCCKHLRQRQKNWESGRKVAYFCNFLKRLKTGTKWKKKDCSICALHFENNVTFTLTTGNRFANFCDKHPKSKSCKLLFGWCCCFRAYRLIAISFVYWIYLFTCGLTKASPWYNRIGWLYR